MADFDDSSPIPGGRTEKLQWCARLEDAVQSFHDAYPEDVFPPLTKEQHKTAVEALRAAGVTSEQLHADWARRIVASIFRIAQESE